MPRKRVIKLGAIGDVVTKCGRLRQQLVITSALQLEQAKAVAEQGSFDVVDIQIDE